MAQIRSSGTWGSALSSDEFAAIRSVGFEPVGQVFGAAVYSVGYSGYSCPGTWGSRREVTPAQATQVSGQGGSESFGPLVRAMGQARHKSIDRMTAECGELGGHGVVGVRLSMGSFLLGGPEFLAIGTAVRAPGAAPGPRLPFTSGLSGQDFAKLIMTGWVPAGLVLGISIGSRHDDWTTSRQTRLMSGNTEVAGWTELVNESRHDARRQLESDVERLGAEGVVIASMEMEVRQRDCPVQVGRRDHIVEATLVGTAIASFSRTEQRPAGPNPRTPRTPGALAVMSLDPERRQAARIRILGRAGIGLEARRWTGDAATLRGGPNAGGSQYAPAMANFAVRLVHGPGWDPARQIRDQDGWDEHAAFMDGLVDDGFIILGGPVGNGEQTLHVVEAADENDIAVRLAQDPWASAGLLRIGSIEPWQLWLDSRRP
jgi:uncharacterized protein YbjQ (UPF0145 family)/uncharacterized protein YciI